LGAFFGGQNVKVTQAVILVIVNGNNCLVSKYQGLEHFPYGGLQMIPLHVGF
jgi:hypothetical protein